MAISDLDYINELRELISRDKGHLVHERFPAPKGCKNFKSIVIREIDGDDEMIAARRAAEKLKKIKDPTVGEMMRVDRVEQQRIAIAAVDDVPTPDTVGGFLAFDKWTQADKTAVARFWGKLNGLDSDELEKSVAASVEVDPKRLNENANKQQNAANATAAIGATAPQRG